MIPPRYVDRLFRTAAEMVEILEEFGPEIDGWLSLEQNATENLKEAVETYRRKSKMRRRPAHK